jgi:addiction module HigA family antidote
MAKAVQSPGSVLKLFLRGYQLNPTNLAKHIKLSQATVRLLTLDKTRISAHVALRLAKFFSMKSDYWLNLQNEYDLAQAAADSKLAKVLKSIPAAKKPSAADLAKSKKDASKEGPKARRGRKPAGRPAAKAKPKAKAVKGKRGRPAKK